ncbi:Rna-Binding Protein Musashi-like 1 [Manis pentadactyla]|nr:Rna-Binding Protein Musashi-like 1 [Manis pentadactyla]
MMLSNINDTNLDQLHKAKQIHPFVDGSGHKELWDLTGSTYWNQGYGYQQGYGPGYGGSDYSPHGYYGYGPGYYYRFLGVYNWLLETYNRVGPYEDAAGS